MFHFWGRSFFLVFTLFAHLKKLWSRFIPPMLKIGKNWVEIANFPPMLNKDLHLCLKVELAKRTEVESKTQPSRPTPRTQKNPKPRTDFSRTDPFKAKTRNARGQEPRTQRASVHQKKKKVIPQETEYFPRDFRRSQKQ